MQSSDLALLVTLDALLQEGSVTRAARRLGLSTPAVSHALARIREHFGDPILVRAGRAMVLTPRAESLRARVHEVVERAARVLEPEQPFSPSTLDRTFVVTASDHVLLVLGSALDRFAATEAPGLRLRFVPNSLEDTEALRRADTDLCVGIYGELPPELRTRQLLTDRFVCVVRRDHPSVGKRLTLAQFTKLGHVQVAPRGQPGGYVDDLLDQRGLRRAVMRATPFFTTAMFLVAETDYVLTISERIASKLAPSLGLRIFEPPLPLQPYALSLVWHPRMEADPAHRWLRELFVRAATVAAGDKHQDPRRRLDIGDPTGGQPRKRRPRR